MWVSRHTTIRSAACEGRFGRKRPSNQPLVLCCAGCFRVCSLAAVLSSMLLLCRSRLCTWMGDVVSLNRRCRAKEALLFLDPLLASCLATCSSVCSVTVTVTVMVRVYCRQTAVPKAEP